MQFAGVFTLWLTGTLTFGAVNPPTIDGLLTDPFWTLRGRVWTARDHRLPDNQARFWLAYDDANLYFAADVTDPNVVGSRGARRDETWLDDAVELYLDFGDGTAPARTPETFQYGFSAAGGVSWTRGTGDGSAASYPAHDWPPPWASQIEAAVSLKSGSTRNASGNTDTGYTVEARIPWAELNQQPPFPPDRTIGVAFLNICRPESTSIGNRPLASPPNIDLTNNHNPQLWQRIRTTWFGPLPTRGLSEPLPLWLGSSLYDNQWKQYESAETDPNGPWLDRAKWTAKLESMAAQQLNALLLLHPHPYSGLLPLDKYPGACWFSPDELAKHQEQFTWLLAEAKRLRISVYLLTWNICLPPKWAASQQLAEFGSDTPAARDYTRHAVTELFARYPDLTGLATMAGESPPGCVDFVVEAIAGGLADFVKGHPSESSGLAAMKPQLIFWSWCGYPEDARRVVDAYPHTRLMHYLQYEQWFTPAVDPRVSRFEACTVAAGPHAPPLSTVTLGGPKSALGYLLWADPAWMRDLTIDLRHHGTDGLFFEPYCAEPWLAVEAFGAYAISAGEQFNLKRWADRLDQVYGVGQYAGQLLETLQHASAVVPTFMKLVHSQSDHYMPQFGLPLTHYLEMPTLSGYVFENTQTVNDQGYLTPRLGLTWPNPDWGEHVATIRQHVTDDVPLGWVRPDTIANDIKQHVLICRSRLLGLKSVAPADPAQANRLRRLLDLIELNVVLGEHFHNKITAAIGWERFHVRHARPGDCIRPLHDSVEAWRNLAEIAGRLYPEPVWYWQSQIVSPPPWTQNQIWRSYRRVHGHWRDQLPRFQREFEIVQQMLSRRDESPMLPLWDILGGEPVENLESYERIGFEVAGDLRFKLYDGATEVSDQHLVVRESKALLADTRTLGDGVHLVLASDPKYLRFERGRPYEIHLVYRVVARGNGDPEPFEVGVRPADGGEPIGDHRRWGAPDTLLGTRAIRVPPVPGDDYVFYIAVHGQASVVIDQIDIMSPKAF